LSPGDTLRGDNTYLVQRQEDGMPDSYIEVTPDNFAENVLNTSQLVIVYFSAENSSACDIQQPEFEAISKEFQGRAAFAKISVSGQQDLTEKWKIEGIPTLIFFKNGNEIYRITGIVMRQRLRRQLEGALLAE
jgi:thioredoxin 1